MRIKFSRGKYAKEWKEGVRRLGEKKESDSEILPVLLPRANPILSCLFYYPTTEQDGLVQYRGLHRPVCFFPFFFFRVHGMKKERERETEEGE